MLQEAERKDSSAARRLVILLLAMAAIDLSFLLLHAAHVRFDTPGSGQWLISRDRGFPELYQYLKEAVVVVLLGILYLRHRSQVYSVWAFGFLYLLVDDSLEVHETVGEELADRLGLGQTFGVDARDLGQVLFSAAVGVTLVALVAVATMHDRTPARGLSTSLALVFGALAFFGVVVDAIDAIDLFGVVEDGGEMVVMTAAVVVVVDHLVTRSVSRSTTQSGTRSGPD